MKEKEERKIFRGRRLCLLLALLCLMAVCTFALKWGAAAVQAAGAANKTETTADKTETKLTLVKSDGSYLLKKSDGWYLYEEDGSTAKSIRTIWLTAAQIKKTGFKTGYYYVNSKGRVCTTKTFRKLNSTMRGREYKGTYYFGGLNGRLYKKEGWITVKGEKYYLDSYGMRLENQWKSGYYLQADGTIAKSKKLPDGTYVDYRGKKISATNYKLDSLKKKLAGMLEGYSGTWSVYVKDLKTGATINLNDKAMYPASTIKAFVMASTFDQIKQGKLKYNSTIKSLMWDMITASDNESFNQLVRYHSKSRSFTDGCKTVNSYLKKNGYTKTGCHSTLHPSSSSFTWDGQSNRASASDCGKLLEQIYKGTCVSAKYSKEMTRLLLNQERRWKIPAGVPSGIKVANKTGETDSVQHDMAIVYGKKTDYILCVFSNTGSEYYSVSRIKNISSIVYSYLNK